MGTKNDPGKFDCYAKLEPDEPYFLVMGRDPLAPAMVRFWAEGRAEQIRTGLKPETDRPMVDEAFECANKMNLWRAERLRKQLEREPRKP